LLPRPGGEGLAGGGAGRGMEGTEIGDDLLLGAAGALARAVEGRLMAGASPAQQLSHLLLRETEHRAGVTDRCRGVGARPLRDGGGVLGSSRLGKGPRGVAEIGAGPRCVLGEDLADALAGHSEEIPDLLERGAEGVEAGAATGT